MDLHMGRFSFETVVNFNRNWFDLSEKVATLIGSRLTDNPQENVRLICEALATCIDEVVALREEEVMKKELFKLAVVSDISLDLHCDFRALLHVYTHGKTQLYHKFVQQL